MCVCCTRLPLRAEACTRPPCSPRASPQALCVQLREIFPRGSASAEAVRDFPLGVGLRGGSERPKGEPPRPDCCRPTGDCSLFSDPCQARPPLPGQGAFPGMLGEAFVRGAGEGSLRPVGSDGSRGQSCLNPRFVFKTLHYPGRVLTRYSAYFVRRTALNRGSLQLLSQMPFPVRRGMLSGNRAAGARPGGPQGAFSL